MRYFQSFCFVSGVGAAGFATIPAIAEEKEALEMFYANALYECPRRDFSLKDKIVLKSIVEV